MGLTGENGVCIEEGKCNTILSAFLHAVEFAHSKGAVIRAKH